MIRNLKRVFATFLYGLTFGRKPISSKRNPYAVTHVFRISLASSKFAIKVVRARTTQAKRHLYREHTFIRDLACENIVAYIAHAVVFGRYVLVTRWIDGFCLANELESRAKLLGNHDDVVRFSQECFGITKILRDSGIRHRDIREKNIIVWGRRPVLLDFGWAAWEWERNPLFIDSLPTGDDACAMRQMLDRVLVTQSESGQTKCLD